MSTGKQREQEHLTEALAFTSGEMTVLYVDDSPELLEAVSTGLETESEKLTVETAADPATALELFREGGFDCLVSEYQLPEMDGLELFTAVRKRDRTIPFILYTDAGNEDVAEQAISAGVSGYLQRGSEPEEYTMLANHIERAVSEERAQRSAQVTIQALDGSKDGVAVFSSDGEFQYVNEAYASFYGYRPEQLLGEGWERLYPENEIDRYRNEIVPTLQSEGSWLGDCECLHRDGFQFRSTHSISQLEGGGHICVLHHGSVSSSRQ